jgi:hypothetical protein
MVAGSIVALARHDIQTLCKDNAQCLPQRHLGLCNMNHCATKASQDEKRRLQRIVC